MMTKHLSLLELIDDDPTPYSELPKLVAPTAEALTAAAGFRDLPANRRSKMNNHLATVCEGIPAMGWVLQVSFLLRASW